MELPINNSPDWPHGQILSLPRRVSSSSTCMKGDGEREIAWIKQLPYFVLHGSGLAVFWVGFSWFALGLAIALYFIRMFAITGFYHRYFSHRSFQTNRFWQFIFALLGNSAVQRGPLWWAAHHRHHHRHTETKADSHSPIQHGFWWSHVGWFLSEGSYETPMNEVKDLAQYPELVILDKFFTVIPIALAIGLYALGNLLQHQFSALNTSGLQLLIWGFSISTACQHHATFAINSVAHMVGKKDYKTKDNSRNNFILALLTLGEGWHNNHHRFPASAQQGIYWWQIDITYGILKVMEKLGIIWNLKPVPKQAWNVCS